MYEGEKGGESVNIDEKYMALALELAKSTKGQTSPNPLVGAIVVQNNQIVGLGAHLRAGEAHAEVYALEMAKGRTEGATIYITLEPCSHYGRTPPCVDKVIASGVKRAVIATLDPNPLVAGRGITKLREAGIQVDVGLYEAESNKMNEVFNYYIVHKLPFVTLKTATTLDGKIATIHGESQWITGEEARADVHLLRHQHDAILVGVNTVLKDDPSLTTRLPNGAGRNPIRIVLDSKLRTPINAKLVNTAEAPTWIFVNQAVKREKILPFEQLGVRVIQTNDVHQLSIPDLLNQLGKEEISSLLVEGGGEINASFLESGYVNKVINYLAPKIIGGNLAPSSFRGSGFEKLGEAIQLENIEITSLGVDIKVVGYTKIQR